MDRHPNIVSWDDVAAARIDRGPLQGRRRRIGPAVGCAEVGLSLYELDAGQRPMPVHVHADEEELCLVLSGDGSVLLGDEAFAVGAGDGICFRAGGPAHALVAGDAGMTYLLFGEGSRTGMTYLPRVHAWWMGPHWLPADGPDPFRLEAAAGPLALPALGARRPACLRHLDALAPEVDRQGPYAWDMRDIGRGTGSQTSGLRHDRLPAGASTCPAHLHHAEEELFVVLDGSGVVELGDDTFGLRPHDVVARPPATGVAHVLTAGPQGMTYLAYGTRRPHDIAYFPRTQKLSTHGLVFRVQPVDYMDGEPA